MVKTQKITVNTLDALAASILAFRQNQNKVLRHSAEHLEEGQLDNKQLISKFFADGKLVPADLIEEAENIRSSLNQRVMMNTLTGAKTGDFLMEVNSILQNDSVSGNKFGLVAWAPKLFADTLKSDNVREEILSLSIGSTYQGTVGKRLELTFNLINCTFLQNYNSYVHNGHDGNGNLISFWKSERVADSVKLVGRIKAHRNEARYSNAKFTVLSHVKVVDEK